MCVSWGSEADPSVQIVKERVRALAAVSNELQRLTNTKPMRHFQHSAIERCQLSPRAGGVTHTVPWRSELDSEVKGTEEDAALETMARLVEDWGPDSFEVTRCSARPPRPPPP